MARAREMDLTSGSTFKKLIIYAIPFILSNILQILFSATDIAVVGIMVNDDAVAAVGANTSLSQLLVGFFIGVSTGASVVLSRYVGARDLENSRRTVGVSIMLAIFAGLILLVIGVPMSETFLVWMGCDAEILPQATTYLRIYFLGMPIMMVYNFGASILRAVGDTRRPLIYLVIGGVANVILNVLFILMGMTVEGVAIGTIVSQLICVILILIALFKSSGYGALRKKYLRIYKRQLLEIIQIGLPSGIQSIAFNISNVLIQSKINSFGKVAMSGNTTSQQFDGIIYQVGHAISLSVMAFIGQNVGAKRMDRVKTTIKDGIIIVTLFQFGIGAFFALLAKPFCSIIASSEEVLAYATTRLKILGFTYFFCGIMECLANAMRAMGKSVTSMIVSILGACVIRILFVQISFNFYPYFSILFIAYLVSWLFTISMYLFLVPKTYKTLKARMNLDKESTI